ncbi:CAMK family protein kinase [Tritrichomonas foetus]|uniref:CAMK family protein kinase n=1 Tax=Tritrichomonas foetus TaxID=1144522 RepID=A0A1J4JNY7_9EUKA|nr:CAMK family protein kinase [Tritrichomonas foetus]|eukprot:OHT00442.1 CAMK family protein kinase [Tritrichomonas foetus]
MMIKEQSESGEKIEIPLTIGRYNYIRTIGKGNYSVVILVVNTITQMHCACKVLTQASLQAENGAAMTRFLQELDIMQSINHPNIVSILDILYTDTNVYVVTEYCSNGELFDYIVNHPNISRDTVQRLFFQIVSAISFLHQKKIAHRDIKPENILLDDLFNVKVADFGFSRQIDENLLMKTPCGSPFYAAPEIINGTSYNGQKSDIWSIGVLLFAIATGALPWTATSQTGIYYQITNCQFDVPVYIDKDISDCIYMCLKLDPNDRPTALDILQCEFLKPLFDQDTQAMSTDQSQIDGSRGKFTANSLIFKNAGKNQIYRPNVARSVVYGQRLKKGTKRHGGVKYLKSPHIIVPALNQSIV